MNPKDLHFLEEKRRSGDLEDNFLGHNHRINLERQTRISLKRETCHPEWFTHLQHFNKVEPIKLSITFRYLTFNAHIINFLAILSLKSVN